jgi:hypothetical protein
MLIKGGYYIDVKEFCKTDKTKIHEVAEKIKASGIRNIVISQVKIYFPLWYKLFFLQNIT